MLAKRLTSEKVSIDEIFSGKFVKKSGFESSYVVTSLGRKLSRVRVLGLVVDRYVKEETNYGSITLDDGTQTVRCKAFINIKIFDGITSGDLVDIFGKIKEHNGEIYVMPEIIRKVESNYEMLRKLEINQIKKRQIEIIDKIRLLPTRDPKELKIVMKGIADDDEIDGILESGCLEQTKLEIKTIIKPVDVILKIISENSGADYLTIIEKSGLTENEVDQVVQDLLEKKICFEPSPGVIKVL